MEFLNKGLAMISNPESQAQAGEMAHKVGEASLTWAGSATDMLASHWIRYRGGEAPPSGGRGKPSRGATVALGAAIIGLGVGIGAWYAWKLTKKGSKPAPFGKRGITVKELRQRLTPATFGLPLAPGTKTMVLMGGFPDTHDMWKKMVDEFGSEYHMVSLATPDYDKNALRQKWGYSPQEVSSMMANAIDAHLGADTTFDLVIHDWGCLWGYLYVAQQGMGRVNRLVALDVGSNSSSADGALVGTEPFRSSVWSMPYQLTYAVAFWVGSKGLPSLAQLIIMMFPHKLLGPFIWSFDYNKQAPRPAKQIRWWMCYPYYQLLFKHVLPGKEASIGAVKFPSCPTLFIYGIQKRAFWHSDKFLARLHEADGCMAAAYDCSHWIMHEKPEQLHRDMRKFLLSSP